MSLHSELKHVFATNSIIILSVVVILIMYNFYQIFKVRSLSKEVDDLLLKYIKKS